MHQDDYHRPFPTNTTTNVGTVLVFKEGVTHEQAEKALKSLQELLAYKPTIHGFNSDWGGPVWYIP